MLIDTHTHVPDLTGVDKLVYSTSFPHEMDKVFASAQTDSKIFCTIGFHPESIDKEIPNYESLLNNPKVVGVGEIGLDYHYGIENKKEQIELFEKQLDIARRANLPVAIHTRDAEDDTIEILKNITGVLHCFTGTYNLAKTMIDRGFFVSASGIITFKNAAEIREVFSKIPVDRIVAETDSPYCAPVPFRGQECKPAMVIETIKCLADIKKLSVVEMEDILWNNAHRLYKKLCQDKL